MAATRLGTWMRSSARRTWTRSAMRCSALARAATRGTPCRRRWAHGAGPSGHTRARSGRGYARPWRGHRPRGHRRGVRRGVGRSRCAWVTLTAVAPTPTVGKPIAPAVPGTVDSGDCGATGWGTASSDSKESMDTPTHDASASTETPPSIPALPTPHPPTCTRLPPHTPVIVVGLGLGGLGAWGLVWGDGPGDYGSDERGWGCTEYTQCADDAAWERGEKRQY
ncbi:hypothetical protein C8J57DRAFT_120043 [Mycena rebaudengoi]|nr:hypothetical protein C8J57DRAFT_120043 [Mycena rebaudengoi]